MAAPPPVRHGVVATHRTANTRDVIGPPAGPPPAGENFPVPRTMEPDASLVVNAWPPEFAFWLGLGGPRVYATMEVPMANPYAGIVVPGTRLPAVQAMFTPIPALPGTGPGDVNDAYRIGWAYASGAAVTWSARTNRGRSRPSRISQPAQSQQWVDFGRR